MLEERIDMTTEPVIRGIEGDEMLGFIGRGKESARMRIRNERVFTAVGDHNGHVHFADSGERGELDRSRHAHRQ